MSATSTDALAWDLAVRVAGAYHNRRLYGHAGRGWSQTLDGLMSALGRLLQPNTAEVTLALLGDGIAVQGLPVGHPPSSVLRFVGQLKAKDVEIVSFLPGVDRADLEVLFTFFASSPAELAGTPGDSWLRERGVERIRIKHLRLVGGGGVESFRDVYFRGRRVLGQQFERAAADGAVSSGAVSELARSLVEVVLTPGAPVATLLALRDRDDFTLVHSVNVATLVGAQAGSLGLDEVDVQAMVSAALTHDIGKTRVPEAVLKQGGRMSAQDQARLDEHTVHGARLLLESSPQAGLSAVVAQFHHSPPRPDHPGLIAVELTRIADAFDGLRTLADFSDEAGMRGAVAFMWRRMGDRFNPYLLQRFATLVGLGQAGEEGRLETGEVVQVLAPHPELAFCPHVVVRDATHGRLKVGTEVDLAEWEQGPRFVPELPVVYRGISSRDLDSLG